MKPLALCVIAMWLLFLWVDFSYQYTVKPTSVDGYAELYGPLSFFQPVFKYAAAAVTAILCFRVLMKK